MRDSNGAKGTVVNVLPSALSNVSETSAILAGIVVVLPTRGCPPIIEKLNTFSRLAHLAQQTPHRKWRSVSD